MTSGFGFSWRQNGGFQLPRPTSSGCKKLILSFLHQKSGGECEIRTHAPLPANGFQDRLVMTASITLRRLPAHIRSRPGNKDYYTTKPGGCQVKFPKNGQQSMISTKTATRDAQKNRPTASPTRIFISVSGIVSPPFGFRETRLCAYCLRFIVFYA